MTQIIPFEASEIIPYLWLGGYSSSIDIQNIRNKNITTIINVAMCDVYHNEKKIENVTYHQYELTDHSDDTRIWNIITHCLPIIHNCIRNKQSILIHCLKGISRSTTVVISYLMLYGDGITKYKINFDDAFELVKNKREKISPILGFCMILHMISMCIGFKDVIYGNINFNPLLYIIILNKNISQNMLIVFMLSVEKEFNKMYLHH
jgi:atypical dual specificity phosphatase